MNLELQQKNQQLQHKIEDLEMQVLESKVKAQQLAKSNCERGQAARQLSKAIEVTNLTLTDERQKHSKSIQKRQAELQATITKLHQKTFTKGYNILMSRFRWNHNGVTKTGRFSILAKLWLEEQNFIIFSIQVRQENDILDEFKVILGHEELFITTRRFEAPKTKNQLTKLSGQVQFFNNQTSMKINTLDIDNLAVIGSVDKCPSKLLQIDENKQNPGRLSQQILHEIRLVFAAIIPPKWVLFNILK